MLRRKDTNEKDVTLHFDFLAQYQIKELRQKLKEITKERDEALLKISRAKNKKNRKRTIADYFASTKSLPEKDRKSSEGLETEEAQIDSRWYSSSRTLRAQVRQFLDELEKMTKDDPVKQIQLITETYERMITIKRQSQSQDKALQSIQTSLKCFFDTIHDGYKGRFPDAIRIANQIICAAIFGTALCKRVCASERGFLLHV